MRPVGRLFLVAALVVGLAACGSSDPDVERRSAYCEALEEAQPELTRTADEAGPDAFLTLLPTLEELASASPSDLKDEWQVYLAALRGLRDALGDAGLAPADLAEGIPDGVDDSTATAVTAAVRNLRSGETRDAASAITQQALDVCGVQIL